MNRKLRIATWAGLALVVATNAVALAGAAWNRSGAPKATLRLTERELSPPWVWNGKTENSGLSLQLRWQSLPSLEKTPHGRGIYYSNGNPVWLDAKKMNELGFEPVPARAPHAFDDRAPRRGELPRDVFIVLEFDGPAYQEFLRRADVAAAAAQPPSAAGSLSDARTLLEEAQRTTTRLFAIDAGLDDAFLRVRYPDRTRYAIVRGRVTPAHNRIDDDPGGYIDGLAVDEINVPLELRPVFDGVERRTKFNRGAANVHFEATVMFGQRAEPWLASAERR